jgi:hypothetical protein
MKPNKQRNKNDNLFVFRSLGKNCDNFYTCVSPEVTDHVIRELFVHQADPDLGGALLRPCDELPQEGERSRLLLDGPVLPQIGLYDLWEQYFRSRLGTSTPTARTPRLVGTVF